MVVMTAVAALGDRPNDPDGVALVRQLGGADGDLGTVAQLAAIDLGLDAVERGQAAPGLTVAQLFLHADIDRDLSRAGAGDNGGVATLLVRLGDALATGSGVGRVLTLSRGTARAALEALTPADGHLLDPRAPARRDGLRRAGLAVPLGSRSNAVCGGCCGRAATSTPSTCGWPTSARWPPHGSPGSSTSRSSSPPRPTRTASCGRSRSKGSLSRADFGDSDALEHWWFRARMVERITATAENRESPCSPALACVPDLHELLGPERPPRRADRR